MGRSIAPFREPNTLLRCTVFSRRESGVGHQEPPTLTPAAAGLAPAADASEAWRPSTVRPATGAPQKPEATAGGRYSVRTGDGCNFIEHSSTKEGLMNNSVRRKSRVETGPTVSKIRRTQRRPFKAALLRGHPFSVDAAELLRRKFLHLAAGAVALPVASHGAWAQAYPARPVRLIVGYPAGGASDIFARLIGQWLSANKSARRPQN
jgi:hypothetical protein